MRLHIATPNAKPMDAAMAEAFARWKCAPLAVGGSPDGWSKMYEFQRCPYRYWLIHQAQAIPFGYEVGPAPAPLQIGGLWHAATALHYVRMLPEGAPGWRANPPPPLDFLDAVEEAGAELAYVEEARRLFYGYLETYTNDDFEPLAVEMDAGVPGIHTSRYDMLLRRHGGTWIGEHKSAFAETPEVLEGWFLDGEVIGEVYSYHLSGLEKVYGPLNGVIINLAFKGRPPTYRRLEVPVPMSVLEDYMEDRKHWAAVREHYKRIGYWPRKLAGCRGPYGPTDLCEFRLHCRESNPALLQIREGT